MWENSCFLWVVVLCNVMIGYRLFGEPCCFHLQGDILRHYYSTSEPRISRSESLSAWKPQNYFTCNLQPYGSLYELCSQNVTLERVDLRMTRDIYGRRVKDTTDVGKLSSVTYFKSTNQNNSVWKETLVPPVSTAHYTIKTTSRALCGPRRPGCCEGNVPSPPWNMEVAVSARSRVFESNRGTGLTTFTLPLTII
jgi:hypothetical protein